VRPHVAQACLLKIAAETSDVSFWVAPVGDHMASGLVIVQCVQEWHPRAWEFCESGDSVGGFTAAEHPGKFRILVHGAGRCNCGFIVVSLTEERDTWCDHAETRTLWH
jgi:hypothetical protein